jgi:hypothetical protein
MEKMADEIVDVNGKYDVIVTRRGTVETSESFQNVRSLKVAYNGILVLRGDSTIDSFADGEWGKFHANKVTS